jgi:integrase/recombinase XerD
VSLLAPTLEAFFTERLITQRNASPCTIAAYRNTLRLLLRYAQEQTGKQPCELDFQDLDAPLIGAFLEHLEHERGNSAGTLNARLAAIRSLFRYAALRHPERAASVAPVIAIPAKRHERALISYLDLDEIKALLAAPDRGSWRGRRDHALLHTTIQTGVRVSELVALRVGDVSLGTGARLVVTGKGGKERCSALTGETVSVLREWMRERAGRSHDPLFPTRRGEMLSTRAVALMLDKHVATAARCCPSLSRKRVTPHVLRHTNAMLLRAENLDTLTIARRLGHESTRSTEVYSRADERLKQPATERTVPTEPRRGRYMPRDAVLAFLDRL